jgi:hypothetical protein
MLKLLEMSFQRELNTKDHFSIFVIILPEYPFNLRDNASNFYHSRQFKLKKENQNISIL